MSEALEDVADMREASRSTAELDAMAPSLAASRADLERWRGGIVSRMRLLSFKLNDRLQGFWTLEEWLVTMEVDNCCSWW